MVVKGHAQAQYRCRGREREDRWRQPGDRWRALKEAFIDQYLPLEVWRTMSQKQQLTLRRGMLVHYYKGLAGLC